MSQTKSQLLNPLNGNINVTGVITATSFSGDGSQLSNIISGVGIQSSTTRIGTGFTDLNIIGSGITIAGTGNTASITFPPQLNGFLSIDTRVGIVTVTAYSGILTVFGRTSDTNIFV